MNLRIVTSDNTFYCRVKTYFPSVFSQAWRNKFYIASKTYKNILIIAYLKYLYMGC